MRVRKLIAAIWLVEAVSTCSVSYMLHPWHVWRTSCCRCTLILNPQHGVRLYWAHFTDGQRGAGGIAHSRVGMAECASHSSDPDSEAAGTDASASSSARISPATTPSQQSLLDDQRKAPQQCHDSSRQQQELACGSIARAFVDLINTAQFDHPIWRDHTTPNFLAKQDNQPGRGLKEAHDFQRNMKARFPSIHTRILQESVDVDHDTGHVTVWHLSSVTGAPEGVTRELFTSCHFKQNQHRTWVCYSHVAYRACGELVTSVLER